MDEWMDLYSTSNCTVQCTIIMQYIRTVLCTVRSMLTFVKAVTKHHFNFNGEHK